MLQFALVLLIIAAVFGFTRFADSAAGIAKILFFVFLVVSVVTFILRMFRRR